MADCPICLSQDGFGLQREPATQGWTTYYWCPVCGKFGLDRDLIEDHLNATSKTSRRIRATLSHWVRLNQGRSEKTLILSAETFHDAKDRRIELPTAAQVALAIIGFVGDHIHETGEKLESLPPEFSSRVGATSREAAFELLNELGDRGLIRSLDGRTMSTIDAHDVDLTLAGWEMYQSERTGKQTAGYGFLAMKFGDESLENIAQNHLKPAIKQLGFELIDMRDVAEPGIIDNIMRMRIRDANFVVVDLTHDNSGAYWEAGYAEGLGKPVLYICEKEKFADKQTHFDTNHCTTVMWSPDNPNEFCNELVATLRRALPS